MGGGINKGNQVVAIMTSLTWTALLYYPILSFKPTLVLRCTCLYTLEGKDWKNRKSLALVNADSSYPRHLQGGCGYQILFGLKANGYMYHFYPFHILPLSTPSSLITMTESSKKAEEVAVEGTKEAEKHLGIPSKSDSSPGPVKGDPSIRNAFERLSVSRTVGE